VVVIKAHHAIVDAHAGKRLLLDFMILWREQLARASGAAPVESAREPPRPPPAASR
jgi:hypothetical protein